MNPPVTSWQGFPLRTQVNLTHEPAITIQELYEACNGFHPRYSTSIRDPIAGTVDGTFTTRDGRSGHFQSRLERPGHYVSECHWAADDGSEIGGYFDVLKTFGSDPLSPTKERVEYHVVGDKGFEISRQNTSIDGQPVVKTYIRRIRKLYGPSVTAGTYRKAIISGIPLILDPQQDTFTYDPNGAGMRWGNTR
jgi:hypothetical protein